MGLPGDGALGQAERHGADPEQEVGDEPGDEERGRAPVSRKRQQRHEGPAKGLLARLLGQSDDGRYRDLRLEHEAQRGSHASRHRGGGADDGLQVHDMGRIMGGRSCHRRGQEEDQEPRKAEPTRDRRPECEKPHGVEPQVSPIGMQQAVGHHRPGFEAAAEQDRASELGLGETHVPSGGLRHHGLGDARGIERKGHPAGDEGQVQDDLVVPVRRNEQTQHMDRSKPDQHQQDR